MGSDEGEMLEEKDEGQRRLGFEGTHDQERKGRKEEWK
jgi:hypothetical protein